MARHGEFRDDEDRQRLTRLALAVYWLGAVERWTRFALRSNNAGLVSFVQVTGQEIAEVLSEGYYHGPTDSIVKAFLDREPVFKACAIACGEELLTFEQAFKQNKGKVAAMVGLTRSPRAEEKPANRTDAPCPANQMQESESRSDFAPSKTTVKPAKDLPRIDKRLPRGENSLLSLPAISGSKAFDIRISASGDSTTLTVLFPGEEIIAEAGTDLGVKLISPSGTVRGYVIPYLGRYGKPAEYHLATPYSGTILTIKRTDEGDVILNVEGADLTTATREIDGANPYLTIYKSNGKVIGYGFDDFLDIINGKFCDVFLQLEKR